MSRENKFRGKHADNDVWIYGNLIGEDLIVGDVLKIAYDHLRPEFWYIVDPETVGQYIGIKDRNSKEIYEGDIILYKGYKGRVLFNEECLQFMFETKDGGYEFCNGQIYDERPEYGTYEVIGNIYNNPEMMED